MRKVREFVDLHMHSHYSDGTWSPEEIVDHALAQNLSIIALTDHDSVEGLEPARSHLAGCSRSDLKFLNGVEVSVRFQGRDLHLLGYFPDVVIPESEAWTELRSVLSRNKLVRHQFALDLVEFLNGKGLPLTMQSIIEEVGPGTIGKAHLTKAIIACGIANDIGEAYARFFGSDSCDSVLKSIPRNWISLEEGLQAILSAKGISIVAHPGYEGCETEDLLLALKQAGVMGIEVFHSYHDEKARVRLLNFARTHEMLVTGGSDCHGPWQGGAPYMGSQSLGSDLFSDFLSLIC